MGRLGAGEWVVRDQFGEKWRLQLVSFGRGNSIQPSESREYRAPINRLIFGAFDSLGARSDGRVAGVLLQVYDRLTGESLVERVPKPLDDRQRVLRNMDRRLRSTLQGAAAAGRLRIEHVEPRPWPFIDLPDAPVVVPPPPPATTDVAHFIELQVLTTRGADAGGIACQITLADGSVENGITGPDGILRADDLDQTGTATVLLPDIVPFSPAEARQVPSNSGAMRITQDGVRAAIDTRTIIEIPPQVYRGRLIGMFFDKNKAFLLPGAMAGVRGLTSYLDRHAGAQLLVVGHTDATGAADYNLKLSVERARAVAAYLKDDVGAWAAWFADDKPDAKRWGILEVQRMLSVLPEGQDTKFYTVDPPTGRKDASTRDAVTRFQQWSNQTNGTSLRVDGDPGPATRPEIIRSYMAIEGTSVPDSTVLKIYGCGEFHPQDPTPEGVDDPDNRRVEVFVFEDQVDPQPQQCRSPGCSQYAQWVDKLVETIDFTTGDLDETLRIRLFDKYCHPMLDVAYEARVGEVVHTDTAVASYAVIRGVAPPVTVHVRWDPDESAAQSGSIRYRYAMDIYVDLNADDEREVAARKLHNLGYSADATLEENLRAFQRDCRLAESGDLKDAAPELNRRHDEAIPRHQH